MKRINSKDFKLNLYVQKIWYRRGIYSEKLKRRLISIKYLEEIAQAGYLNPEAVFIDGTHILYTVCMGSVWEEYTELVEDYRLTPKYKAIYEKRKETIERVFADAKEKHGMRYTQYRGSAKVNAETALRFAYMNLKKPANWKRKKNGNGSYFIEMKLTRIKRGFAIVVKPLLSAL